MKCITGVDLAVNVEGEKEVKYLGLVKHPPMKIWEKGNTPVLILDRLSMEVDGYLNAPAALSPLPVGWEASLARELLGRTGDVITPRGIERRLPSP